jgi:hypothetical protein
MHKGRQERVEAFWLDLEGDGIAEAADWIESAEKASAGSALGKRSSPFSAFSDSSLARWADERLSAEPKPASETAGPQADVPVTLFRTGVDDLLAPLAERMIAMHKGRQERVEAFWLDLEGDGIAEAADWIESAEKASAGSALGKRSSPFSAFSDSKLGHWLDQPLSAEPSRATFLSLCSGQASTTGWRTSPSA